MNRQDKRGEYTSERFDSSRKRKVDVTRVVRHGKEVVIVVVKGLIRPNFEVVVTVRDRK